MDQVNQGQGWESSGSQPEPEKVGGASTVLLGAADILGADDQQFQLVEVPEWNGTVRVKGLTGRERDRFEESIVEGKGKNRQVTMNNLRAKLVALSLVDDLGAPLFSLKQVEQLGNKSAAALQRIFEVAQKLSGLGDDDVEELADQMSKDQSGDSGSD